MGVYLDCAATTPIDPHVLEVCVRYLRDDYGNAASRTHGQGAAARKAVERARDQIAAVAGANRGDVIFTSGATESNNLAILGLAAMSAKRHLVTTAIEHSAVLEPLAALERRGFQVSYIRPGRNGSVSAQEVVDAVTDDTLLVSVMQVNNETGVLQPIAEIAEQLGDRAVCFHTDAAQGFAKVPGGLHERIDLISMSGHKICGPKGVGALVVRRRGRERPPLAPLHYGGGHERGLRPGTLPVALIAALGEAAERWAGGALSRWEQGLAFRQRLLDGLAPLKPVLNGGGAFILNVAIPGHDSDSVMEAWVDLVAVSSGAACSSHSYTCSHVLSSMGVATDNAIRFSWCHLSELPDLPAMVAAVKKRV